MTTYNLNIANISFKSSLDSRDIQKEIDNIEGLKNDYESDLESLNDELNDLESELYDIENEEDYEDKQNDIDNKLEEIAEKENEIQECELEYNRYSEELVELESLKEEIESNSDEGFEYGIQLIHEYYIDDYLDDLTNNGADLDNIYIVYTQSLGEVRQYISKVKNNEIQQRSHNRDHQIPCTCHNVLNHFIYNDHHIKNCHPLHLHRHPHAA